jgi:adenylate cyclase
VLEGSVQRFGDRIRVTAQLIDALSGTHVWSKRYDREIKDLFVFQDEIALRILSAMQVELTEGDQARWRGGRAQNPETVLKYWEAAKLVLKMEKESNAISKRLAGEMIAEDPDSPLGYDIMAQVLFMEPWLGSTTNPKKTLDKAVEMAKKAIALGGGTGHMHGVLCYIYGMRREYDKAVAQGKLAVQLEPSGADGIAFYGNVLKFACRAEEAIPQLKKAMRLNPYPPTWYYVNLGDAYFFLGEYEKALEYHLEARMRGSPSSSQYLIALTYTYALMGRMDKALEMAAELMRVDPDFSLKQFAAVLPECQEYRELCVRGLSKAGLK